MARPASGPSRTPAAAPSAQPTTVAATAATGRWSRRTRPPSAAAWRSSGPAKWTSCGSIARSTPAPTRFARPVRRMSEPRRTRVIRTDYLARVEGEGAMYVRLDGREVADVKLRIYEPPRFFEALLRGRAFTEAPDITARICGICPVAYQMSAVRAMEDACGVAIDEGPLRDLRRLLYCGEWIESHSLHVYMLHAPDFLGYAGAVEMARDHREIVERGLQMKKAGNALMALVGGREIHPINVRVGGFYRAPSRAELRTLVDPLEHARETALATVRWAATLPFPDVECAPELVALSEPGAYAIDLGRIVSDGGIDIEPAE